MKIYRTYQEFWIYYVSEHMNKATRLWHALGTGGVILTLALILLSGAWGWLLLLPVLGYGPAWYSHFFIERNRPATFTYPLWSLRADFRMFWLMITFRMGAEVERAKRWQGLN